MSARQTAQRKRGSAPAVVGDVLRTAGKPLDPITRAGMEDRFGHDFSQHCTVGYGYLVHRGPCNGAPSEAPFLNGITRERALELLAQETATAATAVSNAVTVPLNQAQFDALISFTFNVGAAAFRNSGLLRAVNENRFADVPTELNRWTRSGNRVLPGLVRRRAAEGQLFSNGTYE